MTFTLLIRAFIALFCITDRCAMPQTMSPVLIALGRAGFSFGPFVFLIALFSSAFEVIQGRFERDAGLTAGGVLGLCLLSILFLTALTG